MSETLSLESVAQEKPRIDAVMRAVCDRVIGQEQAVKVLLAACLAGGHALLEDLPGTGKTRLASSLAAALGLSFARVQGTPDLLPADVIGTTVYHPRDEAFRFHPGPIFTQVLLFDEINRATPRTQSALLQAMAERAVTVDGQVSPLPKPFFVLATANPVESQGVFPLPEAELDRFLVQVALGYLSEPLEIDMVRRVIAENDGGEAPDAVLSADHLLRLQRLAQRVFVHDDVLRYAVLLARRTRDHDQIALGASPRSAVWLVRLAQALALISGRHFVTPDDVQEAFLPVMRHRLVFDIAWADRTDRRPSPAIHPRRNTGPPRARSGCAVIWIWLPLLLLAALWLWPRAFSRAIDGRVEGWVTASHAEVWPGDPATLRITLVNRSWMPIPLAEIDIELPKELSFSPDEVVRQGHAALSILPRRQADIDFTVYGWRRGPAVALEISAALSEGLGLFETHLSLRNEVSLAVRPRRKRLARRLDLTPVGWMVRESRAFPDETALRSVRPYMYGDPVRHIHWRATARMGKLMEKEFFSTEVPQWAIVLSAQVTEPHWMAGLDPDLFDALCEEALAIAEWLTRRGGRVFFATDAACGHRQRAVVKWLTSDGVASLLAHAHPISTCDLRTLVAAIARSSAAPRNWVILSPRDGDVERGQIARMGVHAVWITLRASSGEAQHEEVGGVT